MPDGMLLASQKEILFPAATWMNLKTVVLLQIGQAPQNKPHVIPHTHGVFQSRRNSEAIVERQVMGCGDLGKSNDMSLGGGGGPEDPQYPIES